MSQTRAAAPATHASEALGIDVVPDADILRKAAAGQGFELNNAAAAQTFSGAGGGTPLDAQVQRQMESGFGQSLGDVRVHTDDRAAQATSAVGARAVTSGNNIFFGQGQFDPASSGGKHLLAHELTHTVQQRGGGQPQPKLNVGGVHDPAEQEADAVADQVLQRIESPKAAPPHVQAALSGGQVQRKAVVAGHPGGDLSAINGQLSEKAIAIQQTSTQDTLRRAARSDSDDGDRQRYLREANELGNEDFVAQVFAFVYPGMRHPAPSHPGAQQMCSEMMWDLVRGSRMMDWVPRPGRPTPTWLLTTAIKAAWRAGQDKGIYETVRVGVMSKYRRALDMLNELDEYMSPN